MDERRLARLARAFTARRQFLEGRLAAAAREVAAADGAMRELERGMAVPLFEMIGLWQPALRRMADLDQRRRNAEAAKASLIQELAETAGLMRRLAMARAMAHAATERRDLMSAVVESLGRTADGKPAASPTGLGSDRKAR